jgi:hypothetical protein
MTDKELLELAAKAAGITYKYYSDLEDPVINDDQWPLVVWNPLTDDGDALRLVVKLQIDITNLSSACYCEGPQGQDAFVEVENDDPYAATRRAIVKAAAKIKRN